MARFDSIDDFRGAAQQRLQDAQELLEAPTRDQQGSGRESRHLRGAMYLAGYAVECIVKAHLISRHDPLKTLAQVDAKLRKSEPDFPNLLGAAGHSISILLRYTDLEAYFDDQLRQAFGAISGGWNVDMRYNPRNPKRPEAESLVNKAEKIYNWVRARI